MFEEQINFLQEKIRINTIDSNESIILRVILESNIPQCIKVYFRARAKSEVNKEKENVLRSPQLAYNNQDVIALQNQIDLLLLHNYQFSKEEFYSILEQGLNFSFNYLVRPQWTLKEFLLQKSQFLSSNEVDDHFQYCNDYNYYSIIIKQYFESKDPNYQLGFEELTQLLKKVDIEVLSGHTSTELAKVFLPIFKLISYSNNENIEEIKIPTKAPILYFEDKGMTTIATRLSSERENGLREISLPQLATIIERIKTGNNDFIAHPEIFKEEKEEEVKIIIQKEEPAVQFQEINSKPEEEIDLLTENYKTEEVYLTSQPLPPIFTLQEKSQIIRLLFDGNEHECDSFIVDVLDSIDVQSADSIIQSYFEESNIDVNLPISIKFYTTLKDRYILLRSV